MLARNIPSSVGSGNPYGGRIVHSSLSSVGTPAEPFTARGDDLRRSDMPHDQDSFGNHERLESDPGRDLGVLRQSGHRVFYRAEEVEPLGPPGGGRT